MKFRHFHIQVFLLIVILSAMACNPTKRLADNEYLLIKNIIKKETPKGIKFSRADYKIEKEKLANCIKQKPNRKIFGIFRINLAVYNFTNRKKHMHKHRQQENKDTTLTDVNETELNPPDNVQPLLIEGSEKRGKTAGEPPIILDTSLTKKSVLQIKLFLNSKGYFNSTVKDSTVYLPSRFSRSAKARHRDTLSVQSLQCGSKQAGRRKPGEPLQVKRKKAKVYYLINLGKRYAIRNISYSIQDPEIRSIVLSDSLNCMIKPNNYYDEDVLSYERERVTRKLKNEGYNFFSKEYIYFKVDSSIYSTMRSKPNKHGHGESRPKSGAKQFHSVDIILGIDNLTKQISPDSIIETSHNRYKINNIYIHTDFNPKESNKSAIDTIFFNDYYFIERSPALIKHQTIIRKVLIRKGDLFQIGKLENTYKHLAGLQIFKFINIRFPDASNESNNLLDCIIQLSTMPKQSFSIETEGTHSSGNLGVAGNIVYRNKNTFKGSEIFELRLKGALEVQKTIVASDEEPIEPLSIFNTIEIGPEAKLYIPKFLFPVKAEKIPKRYDPKTSFTTAYNYQKRTDYTRYIAKISFGYDWKKSAYKKHILNPIEINLVKLYPDSTFLSYLNLITNQSIYNSYKDHLTTALKYTFIFNNQQINKNINFTYFRANLEIAGNLLNGYNKLARADTADDGSYHIFDISYAQYVRSDIDFRYYNIINKSNSLVLRVALGIGIPYGNSSALPFEKSFFGGGANGIRAWEALELGPGSYKNTTDIGQTGDIKLEGNIEYRYDIFKMLQGAFFVDAGNIWLIDYPERPKAQFDVNRFYNEIAVGAGIGLRLNFTFFIVRLDAAIPVKDPSLQEGERWFKPNKPVYNLGIGYPF
ncbi:MAG: BamA/TamA family outer membrane protein [Bacteroidota bacterium]